MDFDLNAAEKSSEIMAKLLSSGKAVNALDILIAKMKNAVLLTDNGKMLFRAKEVGDSGSIRGIDLNRIVYELKAES